MRARPRPEPSRRAAAIALAIWGAVSLLILLSVLGLSLAGGAPGFAIAIHTGPFSDLPVTLASTAAVWLLAGVLLWLLTARRIHAGNALSLAGFFLVALIYLNLLRERPEYGDIEYYTRAALDLAAGKPLPPEYVYPPLWAALLSRLASLGEKGIFLSVWLLNLLSLFAFYPLLHLVLQRYGFSSRLAALTTTAFMLVNVPLLRTLVYLQVNLHVMNLVFLSLILHPRARPLSALTLALAAHLKASPAALALAFLLERDWRWLGWFALGVIAVGAAPLAVSGPGPYLDFVRNALGMAAAHGLSFRENSFDSLFAALAEWGNFGSASVRYAALAAKLALAGVVLRVMRRAVQRETFFSGEPGRALYNALPPLAIFMTLASPVVWEHHGLFLSLSFLLLLKRLESGGEWLLFGFAYLLEFLLPTFDFFPWSYGRLLAPLIVLGLMWAVSRREVDSGLFAAVNERLLKGVIY